MTCRVDIEPSARLELNALAEWWRLNRPSASSRVVDEYARIVQVLAETPEAGTPYTHGGVRHVRWLRMATTPYLVYYHHEPGSDAAAIVSVWSGMRAERPPI